MKVRALEDGGACGYYRIRTPFDVMKQNGVDVDYGRHAPEACKVGGCRNCVAMDADIIVGQRVGDANSMLSWLKLWREHKLVWETDDDLWTVDESNRAAARFYTPEVLAGIEPAIRVAHMVTVSTEPLAEQMRRFNDNVVVLPNHVDASLLEMERPRRERVTVGWAGGNSHHLDVGMVAPHLKRFLERNPKVELHTIGWGDSFETTQRARQKRYTVSPITKEVIDTAAYRHPNPLHEMRVPYRHTGWSPRVTDYYQQIDFDIGLAPLVPSQFNASKSHIKALEYAALGIPVIASDEGPYREFVEDGVTGFLIRHEHEWGRRLRDLTHDEDMRTEMGAAAKERAKAWVIQDGWKKWADAYASLL